MPASIHTLVDRNFAFSLETQDMALGVLCWKDGQYGITLTDQVHDPHFDQDRSRSFEHNGLTRQDLERLRTAIDKALTYKEEDNEPL